ncbi:MAG: flagellar biosynthesis protein FlhF [Kofleriaceae bacterium]
MKFEGATMRDAVAKVKAELGDQAVIISSRQVRKGLLGSAVEISAAIDDGDTAESAPAVTRGNPYANPAVQPPKDEDIEKAMAPLRSELRSLRAMVRSNTSAPAPAQDTKKIEAEISALRQLFETFSSAATRDAFASAKKPTEAAPQRKLSKIDAAIADAAPVEKESAESIAEAVAGLANKRARVQNEAPLVAPSTARCVMLVGPTGAGKTTTIAKLAAHAALVEGRRVRLVTLDTFRIGGVDQVRTFADLIGIPLTVLDNAADLASVIEENEDEDELTLIDTAGRSPRDTAHVVELATAISSIRDLEVHLTIPAHSTAAAIDELVTRYAALSPSRLLFTKIDEQESVPELLEAPRRTRLPITWVTTGQQVPEDLEQPTAKRLGHLASFSLSNSRTRAA